MAKSTPAIAAATMGIVKLEQLMESALSDKKRLQSALDDAAVHQRIDGHDIGGRQTAAAAARENAELSRQLEDERDKRTGTATIFAAI